MSKAIKYKLDLAPGVIGWLVGSDTADLVPDRVIMHVANDPMAMAMLQAGYPVCFVEDAMNAEAGGNA